MARTGPPGNEQQRQDAVDETTRGPQTAPLQDATLHQGATPHHEPEAGTRSGAAAVRPARRVGVGALAAAVLAAGLVGGGVGAGVSRLADDAPAAVAGTAQEGQGGAGQGEQAQAAGKALPSVVTISATSPQGSGSGSGSILDAEGHILTNTHVVTLGGQAADPSLTVRTSDGTVYAATVVGTDPLSDLAVLKIDAEGLTPIELGSSKDLKVGDDAIAIGAPLGLPNTVTDGIISTLDRTIAVASSEAPKQDAAAGAPGSERFRFELPTSAQQAQHGEVYINVVQTDAAINPGNSGGALVDAQGRLVGVNVAIASAGGAGGSGEAGNIGVGFAIPVDYAHRIAQDLIEDGEATHGMLGVSVTPEPAQAKGGSEDSAAVFSAGARVRDVVADSAAATAGLESGDVITAVGERAVSDAQSLTAVVREQRVGDTATVHYRRGGEERTADVTFADGGAA
ncbi:trypsin-like peptidase domain-containing protein [Micrococcaceae bacterium Sec6.3]